MKLNVKEKTKRRFAFELTEKEARQLLSDLVDLNVVFDYENYHIYPAAADLQQKLRDTL